MSGIKVVFGAGSIGYSMDKDEEVKEILEKLKAAGIDEIDVAHVYGKAEEILGRFHAGDSFTISTKIPGGFKPGSISADGIPKYVAESLEKLQQKQVDIMYFHSPDDNIPLEETLEAIDKEYKKGSFKRFGLSNYVPETVQKVLDLCSEHGWVKPTVYQGSYNAVHRAADAELLPLLHKNGMSFYGYSPTAGGFLAKTRQDIESRTNTVRFAKDGPGGGFYFSRYAKPKILDGLDEWNKLASENGIAPVDMANRWVKYHSPLQAKNGDALIIGAGKMHHLDSNLEAVAAGPLPDSVVKRIDEIWDIVKDDSPGVAFLKG